jgi:DNA-binding CsgD family transcriptional regulator
MSIIAGDDSTRGAVDESRPTPLRVIAYVELLAPLVAKRASEWVDQPNESDTDDSRMLHLQRVIREDDWICPISMSRAVVAFSSHTNTVPPKVLGERLLRMLSAFQADEGGESDIDVAVSTAADVPDIDMGQLNRRVQRIGRSARTRHLRMQSTGAGERISVLSLDVPLRAPDIDIDIDIDVARRPTEPRPAIDVHRRKVVGASHQIGSREGHLQWSTAPFPWRPDSEDESNTASDQHLLIVDAHASTDHVPGLTALAAAAVASHTGFHISLVVADNEHALKFNRDKPELAVMVLGGDMTTYRNSTWSSSMWSIAIRMTDTCFSAGVAVLVVSVGAEGGVLAGCVNRGAVALFSLDQLPSILLPLRLSGKSPASTGTAPPYDGRQFLSGIRGSLVYPPGFNALVKLTISERKVLFYLTKGFSAQEIAGDLVVSLTTVRSHIRSILRKLNVRSQLAAVAIANTRYVPAELRKVPL